VPSPKTVTFLLGLALTSFALSSESKQQPEINYLQFCQGCHRADGSGSRSNDVPDLRGSVGNFLYLKEGRDFLVQVAGVAQAPISDVELAELMNWTLYKFGASEMPDLFVPYDAEEVQKLRMNRPTNTSIIRNNLAKKLMKMNKEISTE
jgi:mono/diheme cytochrome c family protein